MRSAAFVVITLLFGITLSRFGIAAETTVIIDFENLSRGEIVNEQYKSQGLVIRGVNWSHGPDYAVVFDSMNIGESGDNDLEAPFRPAADLDNAEKLWPGNILILHKRHDCENGFCQEPDDEGSKPAGFLEFEFSGPVTLHRLKVLDVNYAEGEEPAKFVFFNEAGEVFEALDIPEVARQGSWRPWELNISGVKRGRFHLPGDGALDDIEFSHDVLPVNWSPRFESHPPIAVAPQGLYQYHAVVSDLDVDPLEFELLIAPPGMSMTENGHISWEAADEEGEYPVSIKVSDGNGAEAVQSFVIHVTSRFARNQGFEFETGTIIDDELLADGLFVSAKNLSSGSDFVVVFDTVNPTADNFDLEAPFREGSELRADLGDAYPGKVIVLHEDHDCDYQETHCLEPNDERTKPAGWIDFHFTQPAHVWSLDVFDVTSRNPEARQIELYDSEGNRLSQAVTLPRTGRNKWNRLVINAQNVMRMRVHLDGDAGLDNLNYALIGAPIGSNRKPVAEPDIFQVSQGETLDVVPPGVLSNDYDPDGDDLAAILYQSPNSGSLVLNSDGSFTYVAQAEFSGQDGFQYRANDGEDSSVPTSVTIEVLPSAERAVIELFQVSPSVITAGESTLLAWSVSNVQSVEISPGIGTKPASGSLALMPEQSVTYSITATGSDGYAVSASTALTVNPSPAGPVIAFEFPSEGSGVNWQTPPLVIRILEAQAGIDFSSIAFTLNSEPLPVTCELSRYDQITCQAPEPFAVAAHFVTASLSDLFGRPSNVATLNFYVDITPPALPDASKISVTSPEADGKVTVTGEPGAIEPGATAYLRTEPYIGFGEFPTEPNGSFVGRVTAGVGDPVYVRARDAAKNFSEQITLLVPAPAPVVAITEPANGTHTKHNQPQIVVSYQQTGSGIDFTTLSLSANGVVITVDCAHEPASSTCTPLHALQEGENTLAVTISDTNGAISDTAEVLFHVDTIPPEPPIREKITLVQEPAGIVMVTGEAGAVEAHVAVVLSSGTQQVVVSAQADGGFSAQIAGMTGEELSLRSRDAASNESESELFLVPISPLSVTIIAPIQGAQLSGIVSVFGHHNGPANTGVLVNGLPARTDTNGNFKIANLRVMEGEATIKVEAISLDGRVGSAEVTVASDGVPPSVRMRASVVSGLSPLTVRLSVDYHGNSPLSYLEIDLDGDGIPDYATANPVIELEYVYSNPGVYLPSATAYAEEGQVSAADTVEVVARASMEAMFRQIWASFIDALAVEHTDAALNLMTKQAANRYRTLFEELGPQIAEGTVEYSQPEVGRIEADGGELLISRPYLGETLWFVVTFARDADGVIRIVSL